MINVFFSRICILTCGILYPGYQSFKTVRAKHVDDYLKWMMYWIVFAIFTVSETFTDIFLTWFPFYYELKVVLILWLVPTMGNGSFYIYKNCVHPLLEKHETQVDQHLDQVKEKGRDLVLHYIREVVLYIGRGIMNVINNNFPNGILGLLANNDMYTTARPIQGSNNIIIENEEVQHAPEKKVTQGKNLIYVDDNTPQSSRGRIRKTRRAKQDVNYNMNESPT